MMLISTSRRPSNRTRSFVKELLGVIPLSFQVSRGKKSVEELKDIAILKGCRRLMIIESKDGNPSALSFMHVDKKDWKWIGVLDITVSLRREMNIEFIESSIEEDLPLFIKGEKDEGYHFIKEMFQASDYEENSSSPVIVWNGEFINFSREDISPQLIGPKIKVLQWKRSQ
ncbi:MAG: putative Brix domain-containing ribosomal biogenesis protein [Candidatus Methanofastidiosum methylothiophilum]|uniref:Putative Brix domain-containing ribosomal biogenesis protein n=1 Tax=Candidatus Methanofastidiosum methylothiophilum TaxID=1705564 RepID=A0A150J5W6_9EURY|nr:MAG: putative Brix domain-containing ribosomal biogenesis protein [Candidatus Methanofastidiosum methylthiophilus]NMC77318.1 hypothetical protein [Candidatus Methanofastidiosa archaeon]